MDPTICAAAARASRRNLIGVAPACLAYALGFVVLLVYLPAYFQGVWGVGTTESGALLLPLTVPVLLIPLLAGGIAARVPLRIMLGTS